MKKELIFTHEFVELLPDVLKEHTVYVSIPYATAVHKCACGCGHEVVTPLSPIKWALTFNGASVSLDPSIGNWEFPCRSHYWIEQDRVVWAREWTKREIELGRSLEREEKRKYFARDTAKETLGDLPDSSPKITPWRRIKKWLS
jgi:hypothetical protein